MNGTFGSSTLYVGIATPAFFNHRKLSSYRLNLKFSFRFFSIKRLFLAFSSDGISLNDRVYYTINLSLKHILSVFLWQK